MTIPINVGTSPLGDGVTPVLLTAIDAVTLVALTTQLTTALLLDGITLKSLHVDANGASMTVVFQGQSVDINQPGGRRGQGNLWVDPVAYLQAKARQAFGLPT